MAKKSVVLLPKTQRILENVGNQIRLARLRRELSEEIVAERSGISRATLCSIEKGTPTVSFGSYAAVLAALGLQEDLLLLAKDDVLGRTFQDLNLKVRKRGAKNDRR